MRLCFYYHDLTSCDGRAAIIADQKGYQVVFGIGSPLSQYLVMKINMAQALTAKLTTPAIWSWHLFPSQADPAVTDNTLWTVSDIAFLIGTIPYVQPTGIDLEINSGSVLFHWKYNGINLTQQTDTLYAWAKCQRYFPPLEIALNCSGSTYGNMQTPATYLVDESTYHVEGVFAAHQPNAIPGIAVGLTAQGRGGTLYLPSQVPTAHPDAEAIFIYPSDKKAAVAIATALPSLS